jgi:hypothetical protein
MTMGPTGSCSEAAVEAYLAFQGIREISTITFTTDFLAGIDGLAAGEVDFVIQCSAHPTVHLVTERHFRTTPVVDTFVYPTKHLALLRRRDVPVPRSLGMVPATAGYLGDRVKDYDLVVEEPSKPIVGANLLAGKYDAGLTHIEYLERSGGDLVLMEEYGRVTTTWVVFGRVPTCTGQILGPHIPDYYAQIAASASTVPVP